MNPAKTITVADAVFTIEPLAPSHDRAAFSCQEQRLTDYIRSDKALRDARQKSASIYCCIDASQRVKGFYTLSSSGVSRDAIARALYGPQWKDKSRDRHKVFERFPYPTIGVVILGRIAIDVSLKGSGFGEILIGHALNTAVEGSRKVAAQAVYLDAKNERVAAIYRNLGFQSLPDNPLAMFILMETLEQAFEQTAHP